LDADAALLTEIDENLIRADLSPAERAMHLRERKLLYEKLHPETKHGGTGRSRGKSRQADDSIRFTKDTAEKTGRSERTIQREVERADKIASIADVPGTPLDSPEELDALAKLPEPVQRDLIERANAGEKITAKHVAQKLRREARERDLAAATKTASQTLGTQLYAVIYADPPWKFEVYAESGMDWCADGHYPCMPTEAIKALRIPAADDAVLFLWSTPPMQPHALDVMAAWGFTHKSLIVWDKGRDGTGYWVRGRVEILLIGTRGKVPAPLPGEQPPQLIAAPRARHSEKPEIFAEIIEQLYPTVPKLEMFGRGEARPNWHIWGNEAVQKKEAAE
jgi:N6-adenosine-specific RNA methylase IME4